MKLRIQQPLIWSLNFLEGYQAQAKVEFCPKATIKSLCPDPPGTSTHPHATPTGPGNWPQLGEHRAKQF